MGQVKTRVGTIRGALTRAAFMKGFREARKGLPLDYDVFTGPGETNSRWQYERGRQFALVFPGEVKRGNRVTYEAERAMHYAIRERLIR